LLSVSQTPLRQTGALGPGVHGASPFKRPQLLSVSHAPVRHARAPSDIVHVPPGTGWPFDVFGWHMPVPTPPRSLHQFPTPHSTSVKHVVPHAPLVALQNGPACVPVVQLVSSTHFAHAPVALHHGFPLVGHGAVAFEPLSPLHATHWFDALQTGIVGIVQSVAVAHATHAPLLPPVRRHAGAPAVGHGRGVAAPKLPVHAAHESNVPPAVSHVGVRAVHAVMFVPVHVPQVWRVVSQSVPLALPVQSASTLH
jgi:hypothetical protein